LDRAVALDPRFAIAYAYRGHFRRLKGAIGPARDDLERAQEFGKGQVSVAFVFRAALEASVGDMEAAQRALETALDQRWNDRGRILGDPALARLLQERAAVRARVEKLPAEPRARGFNEG